MKKLVPIVLVLAAVVSLSAADKPTAAQADVTAVVKGNNEAALDLYAQLRGEEGNLFFSPYSISTALAMTYAGARGDTADEMAKALHFPLELDRLAPAFGTLYKQINGDGKKRGYELSIANALWGQKGFAFKKEFINTTRANFGAGLREVDFKNAPEEARTTINEWVEKQTKDKIKDLFPKGTVTSDMRLALTNAIYFKGDWDEQFKKDATRNEAFKLSGKDSVKTPLMNKEGRFGYLDADTFQALEMPYKGKDLSMVVLLPKKVDGLADLEKLMTADKLSGWIGRLRQQKVIVTLPKFKVTKQFTLNDVLGKMGMKRAFTEGADFSGITSDTDLMISVVVHKAFVDVNEQGTEAAAATGVGIVATSAAPAPTPVFRADHPFLFLIRDMQSGSILFMGRLADPTK
ncbi:MAG TPA: serpin family protein [Gemmataceae bacterium]|nr:serpin family protein [Gemmataceae bacterium]